MIGAVAWLAVAPWAFGAADEIRPITFDDLKFEMEKDGPFEREMLTPQIEDLGGQRVRLRGYILPSYQQSGIKTFILVRDDKECCFGPGAALYDAVVVKMAKGEEASFTVRPVTVEGTFRIEPMTGPNGKTLAVFRMIGDRVR